MKEQGMISFPYTPSPASRAEIDIKKPYHWQWICSFCGTFWRKDKEAVIDGKVVLKALYSKAFKDYN